ncbi:MAG: ribosome maturation factor RimP [Actinomycetota bacterium]|nr:ribosome maturation factor RimP [Actinomycetota bacterium]
MSARSSREDLLRVLQPVVAACGLDLEDVDVTPAGRRRVVRVVVDRDGGVGLDDVADVSRAVSDALDETDVMGATPYVLEVTSPGVDRPLTEPRHWRRARGRLVTAALVDGTDATGRVVDAGENGVTLEQDGGDRRLGWEQLRRGSVQVEFSRPAAAGEQDTSDDEEGESWTST